MTRNDSTQARTVVQMLTEGDVIEVPQYESALRVNFTGDLNGNENAMIGVEFADDSKRTGARKTMIVNENSGRVYLSAGNTDKGEVTTIKTVAVSEGEEEDDDDGEAESENTQATLDGFEGESQTVATDGGQDVEEENTEEFGGDHFDADAEAVTDAWEGAFINTSWGYGQTNNDIAQIVEVSDSGKTVVARLVKTERVEAHKTYQSVQPTAEQYGDEFRLHVRNSGGDPAFRGSYPYVNGDADEGERKGSFLPYGDIAGKTLHETRPTCGH